MDVKLLDCTLRDGGFINDWNFGQYTILSIFQRLVNAGVDNVEIGFIDDRNVFNLQRSMNPKSANFEEIFKGVKKGKSTVFAMIDYGTCDIKNIEDHNEDSFIDGIRVIFKKKDIDGALAFCKQLQDKGYKLSVNPVSITTYSDMEMLELVEKINKLNPYTMSMVDTYGLMHKENMIKYFYLIDNNLNKNINLGYHSHNNFQLAYSNSIELLSIKTDRTIILDGSLYGMGKGAGNACIELLAMYLNENYSKNYKIEELLETIDIDILKIKQKYEWGYSMPAYVAALNDCHPKYVHFLLDKNTLSAKSINEILSKIDVDKKLTFHKEHIERLYLEYQNHDINDFEDINELRDILKNNNILLLGPGRSIAKQKDKILKYISEYNPIVISLNHVSNIYNPNFVFMSNTKRYEHYANILIQKHNSFKIIATSNITPLNNEFDYILNYGKLINENELIGDNSMSMLLTLFKDLDIEKISLAGFDGYSPTKKDYYDEYLEFSSDNKDKILFNEAIAKQLETLKQYMKIEFLTESMYEKSKVSYAENNNI